MTPHYSTQYIAARGPSTAKTARLGATKRIALGRTMRTAALCALFGLASSVLVAPAGASTPFGRHSFPPGSVVVSQGGTLAGDGTGTTGVEALGAVNVYRPNASGDVAPMASFAQGMNGPFTVVFDPSGDLWAANVNNNSNLIEFTKAQLATRNPSPAVTISSASGALNFIASMAFDNSGNLWVVVNNPSGRVYEYAKWQLASSGSPTPVNALSDFPSLPLGDGFDPWGNLWVTTQVSPSCPQGCVVEIPKAELSTPDPAPTVTISSIGGANIAFTPSGDMWMVTGGGPPPIADCFGTVCNNELVEFTKAQLSSSGSPTPAVTISSTLAGCSVPEAPQSCAAGSLYGPYGVAVERNGDVWVSNFNTPTTVEFSKHQLSQTGSPTPQRTIAGPDTGMNWPSFVVLAP
jgi:streptogramin lyase